MDSFSTQYMSSNVGLIHAMPLIQRALRTGTGFASLAFGMAGFAAFFIAGGANAYAVRTWEGYPPGAAYIGALAVFLLVVWGILIPLMRRRTARRFDQLLPPTLTRLAVDNSGVTVSNDGSHSYIEWQHVRGSIETPGGIAILMGYGGIFIPAAAFHNREEQTAFIALVNQRANRAPAQDRK